MANYTTITSDKSKTTALWCCILYLFTGGLFIIGWIIDIVKIATGGFTDNSGAPLRQ